MKKKICSIIFIVVASFTIFYSCKRESFFSEEEEYHPTPYTIQSPKYFPTQLNIPLNNSLTVEGIELGRYLFYDGRLCGKQDTLMSCGTCHKQQYAFENKIGYAYGVTGIKSPHVMLSLANLVFNNSGYLWNGKVCRGSLEYGGNIEDLCWMAISAPHECHSDTNASKSAIQRIAMYPPMFKKAFGSDVITFKNISKAIAQFVRTLISSNSKFDKYLRGEVQLTPSELNGYTIFNTEKGDCFHCHGTILCTTNLFYNNAKDVDVVFTDPRDRYAITKDPMDHGAYKAPTLRNIALTGPYMHDGRYSTLEQVINFYNDSLISSPYVNPLMNHAKSINGIGVDLITSEKADLKAFLHTLTDSTFITNPAFSKPAELP